MCRSVEQVEERCELGCTGERVSVSGLVCLAASGDILLKGLDFVLNERRATEEAPIPD